MFAVVLDTCVLYPQYLRDTLLRLAERRLYNPLWSADILAELHRVLVDEARLDRYAVERTLDRMRSAFAEFEITGYEPLIEQMELPDPHDRHVLAAAVRANAATIVTANITDFPHDVVERFDVEAVHPDEFLLDQLDLAPRLVLDVLTQQAARYTYDPMTVDGLLEALARAGVPDFAHEARRLLD